MLFVPQCSLACSASEVACRVQAEIRRMATCLRDGSELYLQSHLTVYPFWNDPTVPLDSHQDVEHVLVTGAMTARDLGKSPVQNAAEE